MRNMSSNEEVIVQAFRECKHRAKQEGKTFNPNAEYIDGIMQQPSVYRYFGTEYFEQAFDTKMLRAYLYMKGKEAKAHL